MFVRLAAAAALCLAATQNPDASLTPFQNFNHTFQLELPDGWRQIAPSEAVQLSENPDAPRLLCRAEPSLLYAVGPIDKWLQGDFSGAWLYVVERRDEWYIQDDYEETVRDNWRQQADSTGETQEIESVVLEKLGTQNVECIVAKRTSTPATAGQARTSLDVHAPTAQQQIILSFSCEAGQFAQWQPEFRQWLTTLTFARVAQDPASLSDRLWTPILVGGAVGIVLLLLYKHTRSQR